MWLSYSYIHTYKQPRLLSLDVTWQVLLGRKTFRRKVGQKILLGDEMSMNICSDTTHASVCMCARFNPFRMSYPVDGNCMLSHNQFSTFTVWHTANCVLTFQNLFTKRDRYCSVLSSLLSIGSILNADVVVCCPSLLVLLCYCVGGI